MEEVTDIIPHSYNLLWYAGITSTFYTAVINFLIVINLERFIDNNINNCNGVLRATACAVQEIMLNRTCEVPPTAAP